MQPFLVPYSAAFAGLLVLALLIVVQFLTADIAGIRARHIPGMPVTSGHGDFFFRATRALGNTNENLGLFVLIVVCGILLGANPRWMTIGVWVFVAARAAHMACYYADLRTVRSVAFGLGAVSQVGLLAAAVMAML